MKVTFEPEYPKEIIDALEAFMRHYGVAKSMSETKVVMSTTAVQASIQTDSGSEEFSTQDAYHFMLKAGFHYRRQEANIKDLDWLLKYPKEGPVKERSKRH